MQKVAKPKFPGGSLLAAMLGEAAPPEARRAARRLRTEGAPALAVDDEIAGLARGLVLSEVSHSPAVPDALPPLFWIEAMREAEAGADRLAGWIVERRRGGLAAKGFSIGLAPEAVPEPAGAVTVSFGAGMPEEDDETGFVRGLVTAVSLPELLAQMGESSPVLLLPAEASEHEASLLRGFRLSVARSPDALPDQEPV